MGADGKIAVVLCLLSFVLTLTCFATPVDADGARRAARNWVRRGGHFGGRFGRSVEKVSTHRTDAGVDIYAVKMAGGGTVILSSDTEDSPVIAFTSETNDFSTIERRSPLWALLNGPRGSHRSATKGPKRWERLLDDGATEDPKFAPGQSAITKDSGIGDLRVAPLVKSKWSQSTANGKACYNYYTPNGADADGFRFSDGSTGNAVCGCVATAMSQVMRYHGYPRTSVASKTFSCMWNVSKTLVYTNDLTTQGGTFDWDAMTLVPSGTSMKDANYRAIGKLTSDVGISVHMGYSKSSSGAFSFDITYALLNTWGYGSAYNFDVRDVNQTVGGGDRAAAFRKTLFANFDAGYPCCMGIPGHAIVADGYGYNDGFDYVHLNMGWAGQNDYWYNLPNMTAAGSNYTSVDSITYNVFPTNASTSAIISGRLTDSDGQAVGGATVEVVRGGSVVATVTSGATGVWGAIVPGGQRYDVFATADDLVLTGGVRSVLVPKVVSHSTNWNSLKRYTPSVFYDDEFGNSWGNDITMIDAKPPYQTEEPVFVTATRTRIVAGQRFETRYRGFLTKKGLWYAWGKGGKAVTEWRQGDGTPCDLPQPSDDCELMVNSNGN